MHFFITFLGYFSFDIIINVAFLAATKSQFAKIYFFFAVLPMHIKAFANIKGW